MKDKYQVDTPSGKRPLHKGGRVDWNGDGSVKVTFYKRDGTVEKEHIYPPEYAEAFGLWAAIHPFKPDHLKPSEPGGSPMTISGIDLDSRTVTLK